MYFFFNCGIKNLENMSLICPFHPCFQPAGQPLIPICLDMLLTHFALLSCYHDLTPRESGFYTGRNIQGDIFPQYILIKDVQ